MRLATVRKSCDQSRFLCPAHDGENKHHSQYVTKFLEALREVDQEAAVVWDWHCVPGDHRMSIDATVIHGDRCSNFEIDGPQHFNARACDRQRTDKNKDARLFTAGWGLMRLHYKDKEEWQHYIRHHMHKPEDTVQCTQSYEQYMVGEAGEPVVVMLESG